MPIKTSRSAPSKPTSRRNSSSTKSAGSHTLAPPLLPPSPLAVSPSADLITLAGQIPAEILQQLAAAMNAGRWLFAVWHIESGQIQLQRTAANFPTIDLDPAVKLLADDLQKLKGGMRGND